ncbi:LANO_0H06700g1_1 [Lachancea nothofagi CBS 11611]|uniref:LANO_0H06700g1_1 n=1 Tax=Lachancea nothofagi CBS 11611 TaxID=1266666 RepID=A0A1G4KLF3_9SACH|nr:LANO_0H06700g1_1 [Lachancea nothofagi CBS 11611]
MSLLNEPSVNFHIKLNEQSFHIPNELLKNNIKKIQKLVERESKRLSDFFDELSSSMAGHDTQTSMDKLNEIIRAVELLERKLEKRVNVECELLKRIEYRIEYYKELDGYKKTRNREGLISWYQRYTSLLIGDYLTRNNNIYEQELSTGGAHTSLRSKRKMSSPSFTPPQVNTGLRFLQSQGLEHYLDYDILITANQISKSLDVNHDLSLLVNWIKENQTYLSSKSSMLEFETRLQEYVELVKVQNYPNAIICFQNHLIKFINTNFEELKLASGLLVFIKSCKEQMTKQTDTKNDPYNLSTKSGFCHYFFRKAPSKDFQSTEDSFKIDSGTRIPRGGDFERYARLLDNERWNVLKRLFLQEYYSMYGISQHDPLLIYLSLGISTLKTKACLQCPVASETEDAMLDKFLDNELNQSKCPVCSDEFAPIAGDLPYAHHIQSNLFENPVMLPNGNIYDSKKIKILAGKLTSKRLYSLEQDQVLDPIDRKVYYEKDFITMYPT